MFNFIDSVSISRNLIQIFEFTCGSFVTQFMFAVIKKNVHTTKKWVIESRNDYYYTIYYYTPLRSEVIRSGQR